MLSQYNHAKNVSSLVEIHVDKGSLHKKQYTI